MGNASDSSLVPVPSLSSPQWAVTLCSPTPDTTALANSCISSGFLMIELPPALKHGTSGLVRPWEGDKEAGGLQ